MLVGARPEWVKPRLLSTLQLRPRGRQKKAVAVFSLEMSCEQLVQRNAFRARL